MQSSLFAALIAASLVPFSAQAEEPKPATMVNTKPVALRPVTLGVEAHVLEDGAAFGGNLTVPLVGTGSTRLLGEAYAFKGDAELGGLGGGLILRQRISDFQILEFNAFFDALQDREGYSYPQIGLGLAYGQPWFTARVNGYIPLQGGDDVTTGRDEWTARQSTRHGRVYEVDFSRDLVERQSPTGGFDAEVEFQLPKPPRWVDPHLAVGYFYREADGESAVYSGLMARAELQFGRGITLGAEYRNDAGDIGQEYRVFLKYEVALGKEAPKTAEWNESWMNRAMRVPAERQPWPSVSRVEVDQSAKPGARRLIYTPVQKEEGHSPKKVSDCCPSASTPLIFE